MFRNMQNDYANYVRAAMNYEQQIPSQICFKLIYFNA